jgi:hypothetical protein
MLMSLAHLSLWSLVIADSPGRLAPVSRVYWADYTLEIGMGGWRPLTVPALTDRKLVVVGPLDQIPTDRPLSGRWTRIGTEPITPGEGGDALPPSPLSLEGRYREWLQDNIASGSGSGGWNRDGSSPSISSQALPESAADVESRGKSWLRSLFGNEDPIGSPAFDGKVSDKLEGPWGSLKTQVELDSTRGSLDAPRQGDHWQTEEALQVPVVGPLFVFGKFQGGYDTLSAQEATMTGHTGIGCKLKPIPGAEILVRGGSRMSYQADPLRPDRLPVARQDLLLELQCGYEVVGPLKLEYQGTAQPALDPLERNKVQQDLRFAIPLGADGHLHIGARHQWDDASVARSWADGMQLYLGIGFKR